MSLNLQLADFRRSPFPYGVFTSVFTTQANADVLCWLEHSDKWRLAKTDFYEQYEFCADDLAYPDTVAFLGCPRFREELCQQLGVIFEDQLFDHLQIIAHKLIPGQHIGIHNDVISGGETHRLTVQLNRGQCESDGGFFMLFDSSDPSDVHRVLRPTNNSAIAFAISEQSNHAVSTQHSGVRYSLVFCFS